jgi:hypothetical protein
MYKSFMPLLIENKQAKYDEEIMLADRTSG